MDYTVYRLDGIFKIILQHIKAHMSNFGWTVEDDPFEDMTPIGSKKFNNIIATHNPRAKKRLIIACHFDSKLFKFEFVGATDSAVPCAIMLDIAKQLSCFMDKKRDEVRSERAHLTAVVLLDFIPCYCHNVLF